MTRTVQCMKLNRDLEGLERMPYPGELGKRIYEGISKDAWQMWLEHQTMLINEYRLTPFETKARVFLEEEMEKFLFGVGEVGEGFAKNPTPPTGH
ncbi:MAG: oxidative damage protection protein [Candidatus Eutrophobiaceae bacterium]